MKSIYLLAISVFLGDAAIAQEIPLGGISPEPLSIDEITVHSPTLHTFEKLLGDSEADWLLYSTASKETCPRCPVYDKVSTREVAPFLCICTLFARYIKEKLTRDALEPRSSMFV